MGHSIIPIFLLSILLFPLFHTQTLATKKPYIVYLGAHSHGPNPSSGDLESVTSSHHTLLGTYLGSDEKAKDAILYSYTRHINGFAAILDDEEAAEIASASECHIGILKQREEAAYNAFVGFSYVGKKWCYSFEVSLEEGAVR